MAKTKISEYSTTNSSNSDINSINIAEGCAPSGINNAIRELMVHLKNFQTGAAGDSVTVGGNLVVSGTSNITGTATMGVVLASSIKVNSIAGSIVPSGGIIMWSGAISAIPSGWYLCDGTNGTPDLRDRFIIGAKQDDSGTAKTNVTGSLTQTGGSKDAIVVSHTHTATVTDPGHFHTTTWSNINDFNEGGATPPGAEAYPDDSVGTFTINTNSKTTGISVTNSTTGSSGTNANLPPYYALAFIMKS